jgi:hypothetical protein
LEKQTAQRLDRAEQQNAQRYDRVEKQLDNTKKQLQNQGQQCAAMEATLQQSLTAQNAQILQIQSDCANASQQVQLLGKQQEQACTEAKADRTRLVTLEATVKEMRHEQGKMKENEHAEKETIHAQFATVNKQMVALTDEVAKLRVSRKGRPLQESQRRRIPWD